MSATRELQYLPRLILVLGVAFATAGLCRGATIADSVADWSATSTSPLDFNGDGDAGLGTSSAALTDIIAQLTWLFSGPAPPHALGTECVTISGCPQVCP